MTDIRQHLPLILSCVRQHLLAEEPAEQLAQRLLAQLPASYGIGTGRLMAESGQQSQPFDVIVYDKTLPIAQPPAAASYDVRQALVVVSCKPEVDTTALKDLLHTIASAKSLLPSSPASQRGQAGQKAARVLKKLLPLGIVAFRRFAGYESTDVETLALALDTALKEADERLRPEYVLAVQQQLTYSNPMLAGNGFVESTINIAREPALQKARLCYVCKQHFTAEHFFYHHHCLRCGDLNYWKRVQHSDLSGRVALVTGGRIKIGYATALRLLRAGAQVIVTTRFPHDAARRYAAEPDFAVWQARLQIYGLDFRYLPLLEHFIAHLHATYPALDIVINNAAQTVRYPQSSYVSLLPFEQLPLTALPSDLQPLVQRSHAVLPSTPFALPAQLPAASYEEQLLTSANLLHAYGTGAIMAAPENSIQEQVGGGSGSLEVQPLQNSWTLALDEIDLTEFLEVQVINVTAPFLFVSRLLPLLRRSSFPQRFIVNVSAIEGQFANTKLGTHVHTNMAKASLNMLTHTASAQLAREHIYMNSVDPGWISLQTLAIDLQPTQRQLPLDLVDAAARICDPIVVAITTGEPASGSFFKDYQQVTW